tara:strand:+ start:384 stop:650 length:267 start_codon:yes stop_codon:yes gene_type:complete
LGYITFLAKISDKKLGYYRKLLYLYVVKEIDMRNYDEIIGKLMNSAVQMEKFVVEQGEPLYVRDGIRDILNRITKLDEYMAYGSIINK